MEEEVGREEDGGNPHIRARHIKKRALKNKALTVSFDEKDLKDYVTGFHKRKKKRRKEAQQQQGEAQRRKRIEIRKQRKLEREFVENGGAPTAVDEDHEGPDEGAVEDEDEETEAIASVTGTTVYDNGDVKVMVTTSEIPPENDPLYEKPEAVAPRITEVSKEMKHKLPVSKKKAFKRVERKRSRPKPQNKRDKRKGKKKNTSKKH